MSLRLSRPESMRVLEVAVGLGAGVAALLLGLGH